MTLQQRQTGWLTTAFHDIFREAIEFGSDAYSVVVPAYCLMPDHLHLIGVGVSTSADQRLWVRAIRRRLNRHLSPFQLQKQAFDHVLRPAERGPDAFAAVVHYMVENPVRAGLVPANSDWPFTGAFVPGLADMDPRRVNFAEHWWQYWAGCGIT